MFVDSLHFLICAVFFLCNASTFCVTQFLVSVGMTEFLSRPPGTRLSRLVYSIMFSIMIKI